MSRYTLTAGAEGDITDIVQFIAARDGERAYRVHDTFIEAFERLGESPRLGKIRPD